MSDRARVPSEMHLIIPISRARAAERAAWRLLPGVGICAAVWVVARSLHFSPTGATTRITDYALAVAMIPFAVLGLWLTIAGLRQLLAAAWPGGLGVMADAKDLVLNWGPLGRRRYDWARVTAQYFFEMEEPPDDAVFEAHLPEDQQLDSFLPVLTHPEAEGSIREAILRHGAGSERTMAAAFRPLLSRCIRPAVDDESEGSA